MIQEKVIIFDSSCLISFSMNGLFDEIRKLKQSFGGKFIITPAVKEEIIDYPLKVKRFELEALRLKKLVDEGVLESPISLGIKLLELRKEAEKILRIANETFYGPSRNVKIIDLGEASCLALSKMLNQKKIKNIIAVDERTTRVLGEKPENLRKLFERKLHIPVKARKDNFGFFKGMRFIRSAELIYVAYKKGLVNVQNGNLLEALLYAMKSKGCSISADEIKEIVIIG